jgi:hypothetical protein
MKKEPVKVDINRLENWGRLENPDDHVAAFGARFADSRCREFGIFGNRMTLIGKEDVAHRLERLILSKKVINDIKKHTRFSYYGGYKPPYDDANSWSTTYKMGKRFDVSLEVRCAGEYVYVRAYADRERSVS